jgi:hypothetical protein
MEDRRKPRRALQGIPEGGRRREKPRNDMDDMEDNLRKFVIKCWKIKKNI